MALKKSANDLVLDTGSSEQITVKNWYAAGNVHSVQKLQVIDFPMPFALSSRDAMIPGTAFDGPIAISVRVDHRSLSVVTARAANDPAEDDLFEIVPSAE